MRAKSRLYVAYEVELYSNENIYNASITIHIKIKLVKNIIDPINSSIKLMIIFLSSLVMINPLIISKYVYTIIARFNHIIIRLQISCVFFKIKIIL